jgi:hypothetical protein
MRILLNHPDKITGSLQLGINVMAKELEDVNFKDEIAVIFRGDIYNASALAEEIINVYDPRLKSSTEDLIRELYKLYGIEHTVRILDGAFSLVIFDMNVTNNISKIYFARDFLGLEPLYLAYGYGAGPPKYLVTSEPTADFDDIQSHYTSLEPFTPGSYSEFELIFQVNSCWSMNYIETYFHFPLTRFLKKLDEDEELFCKILKGRFAESCDTLVRFSKYSADSEIPIYCFVDGTPVNTMMVRTLRKMYPGAKINAFGVTASPVKMETAFEVSKKYGCEYFVFDDWAACSKNIIYSTENIIYSTKNIIYSTETKETNHRVVVFTTVGIELLFDNREENDIQYDKESRASLLQIPGFFNRWVSGLSHTILLKNPFFDRTWLQLYMALPVGLKRKLF